MILRGRSPLMTEPAWVTFVATMTDMYDGNAVGGFELFPGSVVQLALAGTTPFAKPLKAAGPSPPLIALTFAHWAPQKVTFPVALRSPTTNSPPSAGAYTTTGLCTVSWLPPSSTTCTVTSFSPSVAYVCVPWTVKGPPVGPLITPSVVVPSPQSTVAVKSASGAPAFSSVNVAMSRSTGLVDVLSTPAALIGASTIVAAVCAVAVLNALSVSVTVTVAAKLPSSAYVCSPRT